MRFYFHFHEQLVDLRVHSAVADGLDAEISPLGLSSLYLEPGYFRTSFLNPSNRSSTSYQPAAASKSAQPRIADYIPMVDAAHAGLEAYDNRQPGDPSKFVEFLADFVKHEGPFAQGRGAKAEVPRGIPVGSDSYGMVKGRLEETLEVLEEWKDVICSTDFPKGT